VHKQKQIKLQIGLMPRDHGLSSRGWPTHYRLEHVINVSNT